MPVDVLLPMSPPDDAGNPAGRGLADLVQRPAHRRPGRWALALALVGLGLLLRLLLDPFLPPHGFPFLTFFPAVAVAALYGGLAPGLFAVALSTLAADFCFIGVPFSFQLASWKDAMALGVFTGVELLEVAVIHLMHRALAKARAAEQREARLAAALGSRDSMLDAVLEALPVGVVIADAQGRVLRDNPAGRAIWSAADAPARTAAMAGAIERGEVTRAAEIETRLAGEERARLLLSYAAPIRDPAGQVIGGVLAALDVTEQRALEATLRAFYEASPLLMGTVELLPDGDILHVYDNPATARFFGGAPGSTHHRRARELGVSEATIAMWRRHYQDSLARGLPVSFDFSHGDGPELRWLAVTVAALGRTGPGGQPLFYYVGEDVTEQRRAARAIEQSEARLRAAMESTTDSVFMLDADWRFTFLNRRAIAQIAGGRDLIGAEIWQAFPEAVGGALWKAYQRSMVERVPTESEQLYAPLGRIFAARAVPTEAGGLTVFFRDVTELRQGETALAESEARLRTIVETVPVGIVLAELPSGRIVGGNRQVETILRHKVLPSPDIDSYDEWVSFHEDGTRVSGHEYPLARMVMHGEENPSVEVHYQRGDGTRAWVRIMGRAVRDVQGQLIGGVVALVDVDSERRMRAALAESEARLRTATEGAHTGLVVVNRDYRYEFVNRAYLRLLGIPSDDIVGQRVSDVLAPMFETQIRPRLDRALAGERVDYELSRPASESGPESYLAITYEPARDSRGEPVVIVLVSDVTERARAARELAASEARLRLALDGGQIGVFDWNLVTGQLRWDERVRAQWGLTPQDPVDIGLFYAALHPEDRARVEALIRCSLDPDFGGQYDAEFRVIGRADGAVRYIAARGRVTFESGVPARMTGVTMDMTPLRTAEAASRAQEARDRYLLALEERLRTAPTARSAVDAACQCLGEALDLAFVGIGEVQPDGLHTLVESEWRRDGGLSALGRHSLSATNLDRLRPLWRGQTVTVDDALEDPRVAGHASAAAEFAAFGARASIDVPLLREGRLSAILFAAGPAPRRWSDTDIALARETIERAWQSLERARAEEALAESSARLRLALQAGRMGVWVWDLREDVLEWDAREFELFGLDPAQDAPGGAAALARVHPDDRAGLDRAIAEARAQGDGMFSGEFRVVLPDGTSRWIGAYGRAVSGPDGVANRMVGLNFDVTARREAEAVLARDRDELERLVAERTRDLEQTQQRLAHAQRMEALGQLAGGIAHDFNNVLQAVHGSAGLIGRRADDVATVRKLADMVAKAAERGSSITRRLLAFSRRGELRAEAVPPGPLLDGLREILASTLGAAVRVRLDVETELPALLADRGQLETVLVNLATNARDAMPGGGTLVLAAALDTIARAMPGGPPPGRYVRLAVADSGEGMPPEVLARAAEPFFTTKPSGKGTGLGLAMAKGFAEQSGGALHIRSAPGQGTTVLLWFPLAEAAAPGPAPAAPAPSEPQPGRARVLLVDDDAIVREVTAEQLDAAGYDVLSVDGGEAALGLLDGGAPVDLLLSDLSMPGIDGLALIREAQKRRSGLPAILLTGFATNAAELAGEGAFSLLRKPVSVEQLASRIDAALRRAGLARMDA